MGNKNGIPLKYPNTGTAVKEEGTSISSVTGDGPPGPSPELLASLQSLRENSDYTLLPLSLHQIAESYSVKEDYHWAIQFLQLEKLYHERLLSNLAVLQETWESQLREKKQAESSLPAETDSISEKHMEILSQICRTHLRPSIRDEQNMMMLTDIQSKEGVLQSCHDTVNKPATTHQDEEQGQSLKSSESEAPLPQRDHQQGGGEEEEEEEEGGEEETYEEGQELEEEEEPCEGTPEEEEPCEGTPEEEEPCEGTPEEEEPCEGTPEEEEPCEGTPEEEEVKVEWPTGVPQASDKDLAKLSHRDGGSSPDGLVSILKRRRASLDGLPPPINNITKNSKRKVRFSEPEEDEVGGDSLLILLLLCLFTVVISIGGTALYCTLVGSYSSICTDFAHNVDFYVTNLRGFFKGLRLWLPFWT